MLEPFLCRDQTVRPEWIDYSGHMNIGYYLLAFEHAAVDFYQHLDLSREYRERTNNAQFAIETHINFMREVHEGETLRFTAQLLGYDSKRNRVMFRMFHRDKCYLVATNEVMYVHVDLAARRSAPYPHDAVDRLEAVWSRHKLLPWPEQAGRSIGFPETKKG